MLQRYTVDNAAQAIKLFFDELFFDSANERYVFDDLWCATRSLGFAEEVDESNHRTKLWELQERLLQLSNNCIFRRWFTPEKISSDEQIKNMYEQLNRISLFLSELNFDKVWLWYLLNQVENNTDTAVISKNISNLKRNLYLTTVQQNVESFKDKPDRSYFQNLALERLIRTGYNIDKQSKGVYKEIVYKGLKTTAWRHIGHLHDLFTGNNMSVPILIKCDEPCYTEWSQKMPSIRTYMDEYIGNYYHLCIKPMVIYRPVNNENSGQIYLSGPRDPKYGLVIAFRNGVLMLNYRQSHCVTPIHFPEYQDVGVEPPNSRRRVDDNLVDSGYSMDDPEFIEYGDVRIEYMKQRAVTFINQDYEYEEYETWHDIPTPNMDKIGNDQGWESDTMNMFWAFFGRMFFGLGQHEDLQVWQWNMGRAGAGKSLLGKVLRFIFSNERIFDIESNAQETFGLYQLDNGEKLCILGSEISKGLTKGIPQSVILKIVSGDQIVVNKKHNNVSTSRVFNLHMMWDSNVWPENDLKDQQGNLYRRIVIFKFVNKAQRKDPNFIDRLTTKEIARIIRKSVWAYLSMCRFIRNSDKPIDIEKLKTPQMNRWDNELKADINHFMAFLYKKDKFRFVSVDREVSEDDRRQLYMPFSELVNMFKEHNQQRSRVEVGSNSSTRANVNAEDRSSWDIPLESLGCWIEKAVCFWPTEGPQSRECDELFIFGMTIKRK